VIVTASRQTPPPRPNIVLILADDLGFSDLGCYGSEIRTPNLDRLGYGGVRFTQMYNTARCCPSRASLLTGMYPHRAGIGHMVSDHGTPAYQGYLNDHCVTIAEALGAAGYRTMMAGKWHVGGPYDILDGASWRPGDPTHPLPTQRGFDEFYGIVAGAASYFYPRTLMRNESLLKLETSGYYLTDAISDNAVQMVEKAAGASEPFFLHLAYTAPHWPLHALEEDIAGYQGCYQDGWDQLRGRRYEEVTGLGLLDSEWSLSPRDPDALPWSQAPHQRWQQRRMEIYAAQIEAMDRGIGRVVDALTRLGLRDDTIVMFASDNGGCAENIPPDTDPARPFRYNSDPLDGRRMRAGDLVDIEPGPADTFMSYGLPWANASNAPFRRFKRWVHEGGISTPFIVNWPGRITKPAVLDDLVHFIDLLPTCLDIAGAAYPAEHRDHPVDQPDGESFRPALEGTSWSRVRPLFFEHEGNRAVRTSEWKLVGAHADPWELYNMTTDRTELHDLADDHDKKRAELVAAYQDWARRTGVLPWCGSAPLR
jgi:arylsulfatase